MKLQLVKSLDIAWCASLGLLEVKSSKSTGIYPSKRNRVPEYFFSISDPSATMAAMETPPNMALVCVHSSSVTNSQNVLPVSAEHPLSTLITILSSDTSPEEIQSSSDNTEKISN
jgi:hypothetical protein